MAAAASNEPARSATRPAKRRADTNGSAPQNVGDTRSKNTGAGAGARRRSKEARGSTRARPKRSAAGDQRDRFVKEEPVPKQGFECEGERASGPVQPPGGAELLASAGEIFSEVAKAGLSTGERLFRDVLSRLPIS